MKRVPYNLNYEWMLLKEGEISMEKSSFLLVPRLFRESYFKIARVLSDLEVSILRNFCDRIGLSSLNYPQDLWIKKRPEKELIETYLYLKIVKLSWKLQPISKIFHPEIFNLAARQRMIYPFFYSSLFC